MNAARSDSYSALAVLEMSAGRRDRAREAFEAAVKTDPRSIPARLALANFYWNWANGTIRKPT